MKVIIAAMNVKEDQFTRTDFNNDDFSEYIRGYNTGRSTIIDLYNPYDLNDISFYDADIYYCFLQGFETNGIFGCCKPVNRRKSVLGYLSQGIEVQIMLNPTTMPILSIDTLVSYLPHIPWDDLGNHLVLDGRDALLVETLWTVFLEQNQSFFNAVNELNYPMSDTRSKLGYIFKKQE